MTYERFQELTGADADIVSLLAMADDAVIDFEPPKARISARPAELD